MVLVAACSSTAADEVGSTPMSAAGTDASTTTEASTTVPTTIATTTTEAPTLHVRTAFTGDVLVHSSIWRRAERYAGGKGYDFAPMFVTLGPLIADADLAVCHLEVPIAPDGEEPQSYPYYGAPKEVVAGLAAAGYDRCSTASNHSLDQGRAGIDATITALEQNGLTQSGMARSAEEQRPKLLEINGVKVAHLAYTRGYPLLDLPDDAPWLANNIIPENIIADAKSAREMGAQIVIVSLHWGTESRSEPTDTQRSIADAVTASGLVDLIIGHHTHVVQPIEQINGVWTVFGLGNSISNMPVGPYPPESQDGALVQVDFDVAPDGTVTVHQPVVYPTWVDKGNTFAVLDVLSELAKPDLAARQRREMEISLERTKSVVGAYVATEPFSG